MDTKVNYTIVGLFVVTLVAATVFVIIWLSAGLTTKHYNKFLVYMQESVSGLNINSPVEYNGVEVGSVVDLKLNHRDPQIVELLLQIDTSTPITTATTATLKTRGITGITFISLKDENDTRTPLVAQRGQPYPVIRSAPSLFTRIDSMLDQVGKDLHNVAQSIDVLLSTDNQHSIKQILSNLDRVSREMSANSGRMTTIITNTSIASEKFSGLLQSGTATFNSIETQTLPATYRLLNNLDKISQNLIQFSSDLKQNPSILLRGAAPAPLGPGEKR